MSTEKVKSTTEDTLKEYVRELTEDVLQESEVFLVDVNVRGQTGSRVVEVYVDTDEGVSVEQCAEVSRALSEKLDEKEDLIRGAYRLNVSSPGIDRPLQLKRQYPRHIGRQLQVTYETPEGEKQQVAGTLKQVDEQGIALELKQKQPVYVPFERIKEAKVKLPW